MKIPVFRVFAEVKIGDFRGEKRPQIWSSDFLGQKSFCQFWPKRLFPKKTCFWGPKNTILGMRHLNPLFQNLGFLKKGPFCQKCQKSIFGVFFGQKSGKMVIFGGHFLTPKKVLSWGAPHGSTFGQNGSARIRTQYPRRR